MVHRPCEPGEMPEHRSCALDVADEGPHTLDEVGTILGMAREHVRQIEEIALRKLASSDVGRLLMEAM